MRLATPARKSLSLALCTLCLLTAANCGSDPDAGPIAKPVAERQVETIWTGMLLSEVVAHSTGLYFNHEGGWSTAGHFTGRITRIEHDGSGETVIADQQPIPHFLSANKDTLFWRTYNQTGSGIDAAMRVSMAGGVPLVLWQNDEISRLVVNSSDAIATTEHGDFWRISLSGEPPVILTSESTTYVGTIVVDEQHLFWTLWPNQQGTGLSELKMMRIDNGEITVLATGLHRPGWVISDVTSVYWSTADQTIQSVAVTGGQPELVATDPEVNGKLVADDKYIYWHSYTVDEAAGRVTSTTLKRVAKTGGNVEEWMTTSHVSVGLAVDDDYVYWTEWPSIDAVFVDGWVKRIAK